VGAAAAAASGCDAIVTRNPRDFRACALPVIDAATALAWLTVNETGGATT